MQNVVVDKPYVFVAPYQGRLWPALLQRLLLRRLRREYGIEQVECHGLQRLAASRQAGHGILLAPNHCRPADPFVVSELCRQAGLIPFTLASWHLFTQGKLQAWLLRRGGVFSIYREGMDRAAINAAVDILSAGDRPLVVFPEGVISRANDRLGALMEGTSLIARGAAKKRAALSPPSHVVIHPVALRYRFAGDIQSALEPVLAEIEQRLSWRPRQGVPLVDRINKIGQALLCLKELEYLDQTQSGELFERVKRLIDHLLSPQEQEWLQGKSDATVVGRVKRLRSAILPGLVEGKLTDDERQRRWGQLADLYLAQQLSCYPPDYLRSQPSADRMLETVERFEEDLTDKCRRYAPMRVIVQVGAAIAVPATRERGVAEDPVMAELEQQLNQMLAGTP